MHLMTTIQFKHEFSQPNNSNAAWRSTHEMLTDIEIMEEKPACSNHLISKYLP